MINFNFSKDQNLVGVITTEGGNSIATLSATVNTNGVATFGNKNILDQEEYNKNKNEVRKAIAEFEKRVYETEDQVAISNESVE